MKRFLCSLLASALGLSLFAGCSGGTPPQAPAAPSSEPAASSQAAPNSSQASEEAPALSGEITVMVPDWAVPSDEMLDAFTEQTGVEVIMSVVGWDDIRNKISIAASGGAAAADVVEVDWSWVGEFHSADWLEPLDVSEEDIAEMPSIQSFMVDGQVLALPYANDFRIAYYNTEHFEKAGITEAPETWNDVYSALKNIKEKGIVEYPYSMPMNADESATTSLIWMALAQGGKAFNDDRTLNKDAVLTALQFVNRTVEEGLVDPANKTASGMDAYRKLTAGEASFIVGPTSFVSRVNDEKESQVVGKIQPILLPGADGPSPNTFALPEGVGVTKFSKNKDAAKAFVKWFNSPETQVQLNQVQNAMPTRTSVLQQLIDNGKLQNTGALLEESKRIMSPFPGGVPDYYAEMSNAIYNAVNTMVLGNQTPEEAFDAMNAKITELAGK